MNEMYKIKIKGSAHSVQKKEEVLAILEAYLEQDEFDKITLNIEKKEICYCVEVKLVE